MPVRVEALKALHAAADARHDGLRSRWPALCKAILVNKRPWGGGNGQRVQAQQQRPAAADDQWTQQRRQFSEAPHGRGIHSAALEANEQCAVQALQLLASLLAHLFKPVKQSAVSQSATDSGTTGSSPSGPEAVHDDARNHVDHGPDTSAASAWEDACARVLPDVVACSSVPVRAGAVAAIAGLTPGVYGCLSPLTRDQLWRWVLAAAKDDAAASRAAAAKAAAAFAAVFAAFEQEQGASSCRTDRSCCSHS